MYTGCTDNSKKRFRLHNAGKIDATKLRCPLILIYYEVYLNKFGAFAREKWLKTAGAGII
ncbi:MAG: GIY-YIG nuclease family protein [Patescibacteria group bacterium]